MISPSHATSYKKYKYLLLLGALSICGLLLYATTLEQSTLFNYIDDSGVILIVIACIVFLSLWVIDGIIKYLDQTYSVSSRYWIHGVLLAFFFAFIGFGFVMGPFNPIGVANAFVTGMILFPTYYFFQKGHKKYFNDLPFIVKELVKFSGIILAVFVLHFIGKEVASIFWYDEMWERFQAPKTLILGFASTFAFGNMLNNILVRFNNLDRAEMKLLEAEEKVLSSSSEMETLRASINPHFLYNALNSIASLANKNPEKTEKMALALSSFYRYVTNKDSNYITTVQSEIEMIENYLEIEKIRFGDRLKVDVDIELNTSDMKLPHFLLQPLIENTIKYGFDDSNTTMRIQISEDQGVLQIKIFDGGKPFDENMKIGYGLKSVSEKLRLLYPGAHELEFVNAPKKHVAISINQSTD